MFIMLNQYFDENKGKAMAFATLGSGLGNVALSPLLVHLLHEYSYAGTFLILGGIMLNNCFAGSLFRPLRAPKKNRVHETVEHDEELQTISRETGPADSTVENADVGKAGRCAGRGAESLKLLSNVTFVLYCALIISMPFCIQASLVFVPSLCKEKGFTQTQAALLLSIFGFADITGRFFFGVMFDLTWVRPHRRPFHSCIGVCMGASVICVSFMPSFAWMIASVIVWGFFEAG